LKGSVHDRKSGDGRSSSLKASPTDRNSVDGGASPLKGTPKDRKSVDGGSSSLKENRKDRSSVDGRSPSLTETPKVHKSVDGRSPSLKGSVHDRDSADGRQRSSKGSAHGSPNPGNLPSAVDDPPIPGDARSSSSHRSSHSLRSDPDEITSGFDPDSQSKSSTGRGQTPHAHTLTSFQDYLAMKRRLIREKWQCEDARKVSEEREVASFAMFNRPNPYAVSLPSAPRHRREPSAVTEEPEEVYQRPPVVLPPNPSPRLTSQLVIDVQERLLTPKRIPEPVKPKSPVIQPAQWDDFLGRQADLDSKRRSREVALAKPGEDRPRTKRKETDIYDRLYANSLIIETESDLPPASQPWPSTHRLVQPKEPPTGQNPWIYCSSES
jgi:hypothetical protein